MIELDNGTRRGNKQAGGEHAATTVLLPVHFITCRVFHNLSSKKRKCSPASQVQLLLLDQGTLFVVLVGSLTYSFCFLSSAAPDILPACCVCCGSFCSDHFRGFLVGFSSLGTCQIAVDPRSCTESSSVLTCAWTIIVHTIAPQWIIQ